MNPLQKPKNAKHYAKLLKCKEWRMNNLYWVKDEDGKSVKFRFRPQQKRLFDELHNRNIILKARQIGFTTFIQLYILDECLFTPDTNAGIIAHNRTDAEAFFSEKIKYAYDHLAKHLRDKITADSKRANQLSFSNDSMIRVGTSLRSSTLQYLHVSEHGKLCAKYPEKAEEVKTGALNTVHANQTIFIESTAEGRGGDFFEMCQRSMNQDDLTTLDYKFFFFPWYGDPKNFLDVKSIFPIEFEDRFRGYEEGGIHLTEGQKSWYYRKSLEQGDKMQQEHPTTPEEAFEASVDGSYFGKQMAGIRMKKQITHVPIVPGIPIHTFWDLGKDTTAIWFFQNVGFDYRFVDYFQSSGEDMDYYIGILKSRMDGNKPYNYGTMYLPHDGDRKGMGRNSPIDILEENGYAWSLVPRTKAKVSLSIERARQVLPLCWFDRDRCDEGITCLDNYRKQWDEKLADWKREPVHDKASHGADAFMTFGDGWYLDDEMAGNEEVAQTVHISQEGRNATTGY